MNDGGRAPSAEVAERLRRRYPPPRLPRWVVIAAAAVVGAVLMGWLLWAATIQSRPVPTAQVVGWRVTSDAEIIVTITVDRPDPGVATTCRVVAQAVDFSTVAEREVAVPASPYRLVDVDVALKTLQRATSASVKSCRT